MFTDFMKNVPIFLIKNTDFVSNSFPASQNNDFAKKNIPISQKLPTDFLKHVYVFLHCSSTFDLQWGR